MRKTFVAFILSANLIIGCNYAFSETSGTTNMEALLKLAPRISLEEKSIWAFEVKGTLDLDGIRLRFIVSGSQPNQFALRLLDPRDGTPILVGAGKSFMFYDPLASEVLWGGAVSLFTFKMNPDDQNLTIGFGLHSIRNEKEGRGEEKPETTLIDIHSVLASLRQGLEIRAKESNRFVVEGKTKRGGRVVAYVSPSRREGPYTRLELYESGGAGAQPFLVMDEIVLNQPLPAGRFAFSEKKLLASALSTRQMSDDLAIKATLSLDKFYIAVMARLVLAGVDNPELKSIVEKMSMNQVDWDQVKKKDEAIAITLKSIFRDVAVE
jgi:hypothetical protein